MKAVAPVARMNDTDLVTDTEEKQTVIWQTTEEIKKEKKE